MEYPMEYVRRGVTRAMHRTGASEISLATGLG